MIAMRLKFGLLALPLLALSVTPATAQDIIFAPGTGESSPATFDRAGSQTALEDHDEGVGAIADSIGNPSLQAGVAAAVERAAGAVMNMPIGPMADAIERARPGTVRRDIRSDSTLADIAGPDSRYLPQELGERSREAMNMMSGFARIMAAMMPEFERVGRDMEESFRAAKAEARSGRY
jgi:hypothetical protein